ncbi:MAG: nucleotide exchange factor GrpE [Prevotellaceae bacterium]|nr:nucleotide exchange factor GrpE [Prevotellaceae bacterium]
MVENKHEYQEQHDITNDGEVSAENIEMDAAAQNEPAETELTDAATEKMAELQDKYLRLSAEFDNYRKRTLKERVELIKNAGEDILKELLPVIDDFERAIDTMQTAVSMDAVSEGTQLIYNKFKSIVEGRGLKEICPVDEDFDPDIHEAIAKAPAPDGRTGKIIDVVQKGYSLNEKIIRHPKVVIGE